MHLVLCLESEGKSGRILENCFFLDLPLVEIAGFSVVVLQPLTFFIVAYCRGEGEGSFLFADGIFNQGA